MAFSRWTIIIEPKLFNLLVSGSIGRKIMTRFFTKITGISDRSSFSNCPLRLLSCRAVFLKKYLTIFVFVSRRIQIYSPTHSIIKGLYIFLSPDVKNRYLHSWHLSRIKKFKNPSPLIARLKERIFKNKIEMAPFLALWPASGLVTSFSIPLSHSRGVCLTSCQVL